jgi:adenine phosphoribosyltransferase
VRRFLPTPNQVFACCHSPPSGANRSEARRFAGSLVWASGVRNEMTMSDTRIQQIAEKIRSVPDFPKKGIMFRDITPLLGDGKAFGLVTELFVEQYKSAKIDKIVSIESRGFIFGAALAQALGVGFVPVRKPGKLPGKARSITYALEYGTDTLEIHEDAIQKGERTLIVDDVLATGGTATAARDLSLSCGAEVIGCAFLIELTFLPGQKKLEPSPVFSIIKY